MFLIKLSIIYRVYTKFYGLKVLLKSSEFETRNSFMVKALIFF